MKIYISGISGTGMGPLALMAKSAGMEVFGSDLAGGAVTNDLVAHGIKVYLGEQDGEFLQARVDDEGVDWYVHTSALPEKHPELKLAKKLDLKISKRDEFLNFLIKKMQLKLVAIAGTHGKTTTTAMIVWAAKQLGMPLSYSVGTTLPFAPAGNYDPKSKYFVYEADEYDRNFLSFHPWLAIIPTVSFDHPDIYANEEEYLAAFAQFEAQSREVLKGDEVATGLTLAGEARRYDATLAIDAIEKMLPQSKIGKLLADRRKKLVKIMNEFPGIGRRFEQISEGYYSDYAHHPEEVAATVAIALEEADRRGLKGVVAIYEPHQNSRQVGLAGQYAEAFNGVKKLYWLPTYLTRENPEIKKILQPADFIATLTNKKDAEAAELDEKLAKAILDWREKGYLILLMTAGPADAWMRKLVYAPNQESAATQLLHAPRSVVEGKD